MNKLIAISGFPGSGKTRLMYELSERIQMAFLEYDHYQDITSHPVEEVLSWMNGEADYSQFFIPKLADDLQKLKLGESIIEPVTDRKIEPQGNIFFVTLLGREHRDTGQHIDTLVWLDVELDVALARNIGSFNHSFLSGGQQQEIKNYLQWLDGYLDNYLGLVREMLLAQRQKIRQSADIIIDANVTPDELASRLMDELSLT